MARIKVTPDHLRTEARGFWRAVDRLGQQQSNIRRACHRLDSCLDSKHRARIESRASNADRMARQLGEQARQLAKGLEASAARFEHADGQGMGGVTRLFSNFPVETSSSTLPTGIGAGVGSVSAFLWEMGKSGSALPDKIAGDANSLLQWASTTPLADLPAQAAVGLGGLVAAAASPLAVLSLGLPGLAGATAGLFPQGVTSTNTQMPTKTPPPRIYINNGINSRAKDGQSDPGAMKMKGLLERYGYSEEEEVKVSPASYNDDPNPDKGIDWIGVDQTIDEAVLGKYGKHTKEIKQYILDDLEEHPLQPKQKIVIVGHSGGGAPTANLPGMIEKEGYNVQGVVTMGSPLVPSWRAQKYGKVVQITDKRDALGWAGLMPGTKWRRTYSIEGSAHNSYYESREVVNILAEEFPSIVDGMNQTSLY